MVLKKGINFLFKIIVLALLVLNSYFGQYINNNNNNKQEIEKKREDCDSWYKTGDTNLMRICYNQLGQCDRVDVSFDRTGFFVSIPYSILRKSTPKTNIDIEFELKAVFYNKSVASKTGKINKTILFDNSLANCPAFDHLELMTSTNSLSFEGD